MGELPDKRMRQHGARRGYDISSRARQVTAADFDRFDYICAMDDNNVRSLLQLARSADDCHKILCAARFMTHHPRYDSIPDPYYGGDTDFELALDLIEDACDGMLRLLLRRGGKGAIGIGPYRSRPGSP